MSNKLIALTGPSQFTPECIHMIEEALNANVVMLYQNRMENVQQWLDACDGLLIAGGIDMHPTLYEQNIMSHCGLSKFDYTRDLKELMSIDYCFKIHKPMLGICRGHQLMGVYKGLGEDFIIDLDGAIVHQPSKYQITVNRNEPAHAINIIFPDLFSVKDPQERKVLKEVGLNKNYQLPIAWVNSFHHQAVRYEKKNKESYAKKNLKVLATAPSGMQDKSQIIELMIGTGPENHWITTQWHPEIDWDQNSASQQVIMMFNQMIERYQKEK